MKIIKPSFEILDPVTPEGIRNVLTIIEKAGRIAYASEGQTTEDSADPFIRRLIARGHESVLEHSKMTVLFTVDRGITHEAVRHRIASFTQESTRFCNYSQDKFGNELTFIDSSECITGDPEWFDVFYNEWMKCMEQDEYSYLTMVNHGVPPEWARSILPNSLKSKIVVTCNFREWRHIFDLRAAGITGKPHPQMVEVMVPLLEKCAELWPCLFGDIWELCNQPKPIE